MTPSTMKAARFYQAGEPLRIEDVPVPQPGPGQVLIKVEAVGVCGSDVHIAIEGVTPTSFAPITLGHEPSGVVEKLGPEVEGFAPGHRVSVCPFLVCGHCINCRAGRQQVCLNRRCIGIQADGALAEYLCVPAENLTPLPDNVPFEQGAIITDAVATPFHALTAVGRLTIGETVAIFGCGGLGIHGVQLARLMGASQVIAVDVRDSVLEGAKEVGADLTINAARDNAAQAILDATSGGVDLAVELVGMQVTIASAVESLRVGGRAVVAGLGPDPITTLPPTQFVRNEAALLGSYGFTISEIATLMNLCATGRLDLSGSVTEVLPLSAVNDALQTLHDKSKDIVRQVIRPQD